MTDPEVFKFESNVDAYTANNAFTMYLPTGISTKTELLKVYYEMLKLPDYFGFNWDALFECIRDLNWINERLVAIIHRDIPSLKLDELRTYIDLLSDACLFWKSYENHQLDVIFREDLREEICKIISLQ